jgi:hypothetical protein
MTKVFISYAREDEPVAGELTAALGRSGFTVFRDVERVRAGGFAEQLDKGIADCDVFVLLISPASVRSNYVLRELHVAVDDHDRPVLPVVIADADVAPFRLLIAGQQRLAYVPGDTGLLADVVDGVYASAARGRRQRPEDGSAFLRGIGVALTILGIAFVFGGMGYFILLFAQAWNQEPGPDSGPPANFPIAFGIFFIGMVLAVVGGGLRHAGRRRWS